jgi:hypothetical protein
MADENLPLINDPRTGQFLTRPPGSGTKKGARHRITALIREHYAQAVENGEAANPLMVLDAIMRESRDEAIRVQAAAKLLPYWLPKRIEISEGAPDDEREIERLHRFKLAIRGALPVSRRPLEISGETGEPT